MFKARLQAISRGIKHADSSRWVVLIALGVLLGWYFWEILVDLWFTHRFRSLAFLFAILAVPAAGVSTLKLVERDPSRVDSRLRLGRGIIGLIVLNAATAILAIQIASAIKPSYPFETPLLVSQHCCYAKSGADSYARDPCVYHRAVRNSFTDRFSNAQRA